MFSTLRKRYTLASTIAALASALAINSTVQVAPGTSSTGNVLFGANITNNNACAILVRREGTLATNVAGDQLSSQNPGGQSGIADIFAIFPYEISISPPPFFTSRPSGGDDGVVYSTFFSGRALNANGSNFAIQSGTTPVQLSNFFSFTRVNVDLVADRPDPFPAGNYETFATVRCE
ncbi:MAG: hypothetical protein AAGA76_16315 [Pseudomonadota bacterium]